MGIVFNIECNGYKFNIKFNNLIDFKIECNGYKFNINNLIDFKTYFINLFLNNITLPISFVNNITLPISFVNNITLPISFVKNNPSTYLGKSKPGTFAKPPKTRHPPQIQGNEHFFKVGRII